MESENDCFPVWTAFQDIIRINPRFLKSNLHTLLRWLSLLLEKSLPVVRTYGLLIGYKESVLSRIRPNWSICGFCSKCRDLGAHPFSILLFDVDSHGNWNPNLRWASYSCYPCWNSPVWKFLLLSANTRGRNGNKNISRLKFVAKGM